jgi:hypothetical protein
MVTPCMLGNEIAGAAGTEAREYPARAASGKVDNAEADEVIDTIAKTVAELTS